MLIYYLELAEYILKAILKDNGLKTYKGKEIKQLLVNDNMSITNKLGLMWMIYFVYLSFKESD